MAIETGLEAPDFTLKTQNEEEWTLSQHRGKNIVLMFYPLDWSPTCEAENCKISTEPVFDFEDTVVVGISRDSTWSHKAWAESKGIKHDLLADPMLEVAGMFDLVHPAVPFISHRATVVIDKGFNVRHVQVQEKTPEARDFDEIRNVLAEIG